MRAQATNAATISSPADKPAPPDRRAEESSRRRRYSARKRVLASKDLIGVALAWRAVAIKKHAETLVGINRCPVPQVIKDRIQLRHTPLRGGSMSPLDSYTRIKLLYRIKTENSFSHRHAQG